MRRFKWKLVAREQPASRQMWRGSSTAVSESCSWCPNSDNLASFSIPTFLTSPIAIIRELDRATKALQSHPDLGVVMVRLPFMQN